MQSRGRGRSLITPRERHSAYAFSTRSRGWTLRDRPRVHQHLVSRDWSINCPRAHSDPVPEVLPLCRDPRRDPATTATGAGYLAVARPRVDNRAVTQFLPSERIHPQENADRGSATSPFGCSSVLATATDLLSMGVVANE